MFRLALVSENYGFNFDSYNLHWEYQTTFESYICNDCIVNIKLREDWIKFLKKILFQILSYLKIFFILQVSFF